MFIIDKCLWITCALSVNAHMFTPQRPTNYWGVESYIRLTACRFRSSTTWNTHTHEVYFVSIWTKPWVHESPISCEYRKSNKLLEIVIQILFLQWLKIFTWLDFFAFGFKYCFLDCIHFQSDSYYNMNITIIPCVPETNPL